MPAYSLADPVVSVFVILPVLLSGPFALGVYCVATNGGHDPRGNDGHHRRRGLELRRLATRHAHAPGIAAHLAVLNEASLNVGDGMTSLEA